MVAARLRPAIGKGGAADAAPPFRILAADQEAVMPSAMMTPATIVN
jgi:hypothetical protein